MSGRFGTNAILLVVGAAIALGCGSHGDGIIQASVSGSAAAVTSLTWSLAVSGATPATWTVVQTGNVTLDASGSATFEITGVPAGSDYQLGFDGYSPNRATQCSCSKGLSVVASATTNVTESTICTGIEIDAGLGIDGGLADGSHSD